MNTIAAIQRNFKKLNLAKAAMQVVKDNDEKILNLNRKQLFTGLNSQGQRIGRYRNNNYAIEKHKRNAAAGLGNVDLFDTGELFKKMKLTIIDNHSFDLNSKDVKAPDLQNKYGPTIFGINEQSRKEMIDRFFQSDLRKKINEITNL
jgi:hypothetical protein